MRTCVPYRLHYALVQKEPELSIMQTGTSADRTFRECSVRCKQMLSFFSIWTCVGCAEMRIARHYRRAGPAPPFVHFAGTNATLDHKRVDRACATRVTLGNAPNACRAEAVCATSRTIILLGLQSAATSCVAYVLQNKSVYCANKLM